MAETVRKNLGMVTAYAYAVSKGYSGTEEEFAELMASYADVAQDAEASAQAAAQSATTAEQKATQAAGSATNAAISATSASESAQAAAGSSNSASLYAQNASASATNAAGSASSASTHAGNASASAQDAEGSANAAQASATQATGSATTATAKAGEAATSATTAVEAAQRAEDAAATLVIDDTLTHAGQAADAKKTGDGIGELKENLSESVGDLKYAIDNTIIGQYPVELNATKNAYINENNGKLVPYNGWMASDFIDCDGLAALYIYTTTTSIYGAFYSDKNENSYISRLTVVAGNNTVKVPQNAKYCRLSNTSAAFSATKIQSKATTEINDIIRDNTIINERLNNISIKTGTSAVVGKYSDTSGVIKNNNDYAYIVMPYKQGDIAIEGAEQSGIINCFSSSDTLLQTSGWAESINGIKRASSIPNGTAYIIVSFHVEYVDTINVYGNKLAETASNSQTIESLKNTADGVLIKTQNARHIPSNTGTPLTLLHFSDIHADTAALARIMSDSATHDVVIDGAICTGDMVDNTATQIASWWDSSVMTCIGNHDSASYSDGAYNWTALSMADRDAYYISPFESNWGITHTAGTSYYYKDYTTQKVRLIVLDVMLYNDNGAEATAQTSWLENLLADAITNNLHVLIAIHTAHGGAIAKECSFSRYNQGAMPTYNDCNTPQIVIDAVATKITAGLKFVGYICGHTHQDNIWDAENDGKQLMLCVTCSNVANANQWGGSDQYRGTDADAYNIVTIDTANTLVKIVRGGGADIDDHMRTRKAICFNYSTGEKVGEVL